MQYRRYKLTRAAERLECSARTKGEARSIFKRLVGLHPGQRLRAKVRVAGPKPQRMVEVPIGGMIALPQVEGRNGPGRWSIFRGRRRTG